MESTLDRITLPDYTRREELANSITHATGVLFGIAVTIVCVAISIAEDNIWGIAAGGVYGISMIILYGVSCTYHGLTTSTPSLVRIKKIMRVTDHCVIYLLIGGTYTPIVLCALREVSPIWAWTLFGAVWGCAAVGTVFTAIDLKKYSKLSMACYIGMGWCVIIAIKPVMASIAVPGLIWLLAGGAAYTIGAVLYAIGKKHRYIHSVFHIFVLTGSVMHFVCIAGYIL